MKVSLRPLEDADLEAIYRQVTDPESIRMAGCRDDRVVPSRRPARSDLLGRPAQWGRGIASAALQILLAETAERPVYARAASDNAGSLRVLERAGFRRVGVDRGFAPGRGEEIEETILRLD